MDRWLAGISEARDSAGRIARVGGGRDGRAAKQRKLIDELGG
jgi:hypothetical protein